MIVIVEEAAVRMLDAIRTTFAERGVRVIRTCHIGQCTVLFTDQGSFELAHQIRSDWPGVRVSFPVVGSPLCDRLNFPVSTIVGVGSTAVGGAPFTVMAGPCAVEGPEQLRATAVAVRENGAAVLRGGAYKPRTSPYSFQGTGPQGVELLSRVGRQTAMPVVSEVVDPRHVGHLAEHVDLLQIGTRNAQNFALLTEVGRSGVPVLLKRGFGCTIDEWLGAAEYILLQGNSNVILCERGIRTFESGTRFTLDLAAVALVKRRSHLPIVVDPSHGTGNRELVPQLALAAAAAGADGLLLDVHIDPASAKCDADQALSSAEFHAMMRRLEPVVNALGRGLTQPVSVEAA
jgi:3-deoxy-7-phosphoheptulonate synthase